VEEEARIGPASARVMSHTQRRPSRPPDTKCSSENFSMNFFLLKILRNYENLIFRNFLKKYKNLNFFEKKTIKMQRKIEIRKKIDYENGIFG
jgi:hypothetical protein